MPVPCFLLFLVSEKYLRKYSRNWTISFLKSVFHRERSRKPNTRRSGPPRRRHHVLARQHPWPREDQVWAPRGATDFALSPTNTPQTKNPRTVFDISSTGPERRRHRRQDSGDRSLCSGTLPGRGIAPVAISIDSTAISIAVADSYDEEWVVLPRGCGIYGSYVVYLSLPWCDLLCDHELCNLVEYVMLLFIYYAL